MEFYMIEGSLTMSMFGGWLQMSMDALTLGLGLGALGQLPQDTAEIDFAGTYTATQWLSAATYMGQETVDGVETHHYALDTDTLDLDALPAGMEVASASGDLYTAVEGDYVVHLELSLEGTNLTAPGQAGEAILSEGSLDYRSSLSEINEPRTIELPEEVQEAIRPPEDVPVPDGASQIAGASMLGASMHALLVMAPADDVIAFYVAEMPEFGWREVEGQESEAEFAATYAKGERTINIEIDGGDMAVSSVMLSSGDPEMLLPLGSGL
jgi:hypothetical protein